MAPSQSFRSEDLLLLVLPKTSLDSCINNAWNPPQKVCATSSSSAYSAAQVLRRPFGGNDYGSYWDFNIGDNDAQDALFFGQSFSAESLSSMISDVSYCGVSEMCTGSYRKSHQSIDSRMDTIFLFENNLAPVSCRSFESSMSSRCDRLCQVCVSIGGFRIVQDLSGERAEFKIVMGCNGVERVGWKDFTHFEELAQACCMFSNCEKPTGWLSFFQSPLPQTSFRETIDLTESILAWGKVLEHKAWNWYQSSLSVKRLMGEIGVLEIFLKHILFEIPSPSILTEFVA